MDIEKLGVATTAPATAAVTGQMVHKSAPNGYIPLNNSRQDHPEAGKNGLNGPSQVNGDIQFLELFVPDENSRVYFQLPTQLHPGALRTPVTSLRSATVTKPLLTKVSGASAMPQLQLQLLQSQMYQPSGQSTQLSLSSFQNQLSLAALEKPRDVNSTSNTNLAASALPQPQVPKPPQKDSSNVVEPLVTPTGSLQQLNILQANLREIHSYSAPIDQTCHTIEVTTTSRDTEATNTPRIGFTQPSKSFIKSEAPLPNVPHGKGQPCVLTCCNTSNGNTNYGCHIGWGNQPTKEVVKQLDKSPGSALEQLLLSDIGCPPNWQVVQEHFRHSVDSQEIQQTGVHIKPMSTQNNDLKSAKAYGIESSANNRKRKYHRSGKHHSPVIMEKRSQKKKFSKTRGMLNRRKLTNHRKQRPDNLAEIQVTCKQNSMTFEGVLQVLPSAEYGLPLTQETLGNFKAAS